MIVASLILLVAMIGAIVLTLQQQQNETSSVRRQDIFGQISTSNQL
jgi:hypothetical protein